MQTVGFIGLGTMGGPMASHLVNNDYPLVVYDLIQERAQRFQEQGGRTASSPLETAQGCRILCLMVLTAGDVEAVLFGDQGAAEGLESGSIVVILSTIPPEEARSIAKRLSTLGIATLDAPVSGGRQGAEEGSLAIMVGGDREAFDTVQPVLHCMGEAITHVGDIGSGQVAKAANQIIVSLNRAAVGEALLFAAKAGTDPETVRQALLGGYADSTTLRGYGARQAKKDMPIEFSSPIIAKDVVSIAEIGDAMGLDLPFTALVASKYRDKQS
ncbi:MAG: NAD(P)-binding domain-containing protein [Pseudomonadota bacterium]